MRAYHGENIREGQVGIGNHQLPDPGMRNPALVELKNPMVTGDMWRQPILQELIIVTLTPKRPHVGTRMKMSMRGDNKVRRGKKTSVSCKSDQPLRMTQMKIPMREDNKVQRGKKTSVSCKSDQPLRMRRPKRIRKKRGPKMIMQRPKDLRTKSKNMTRRMKQKRRNLVKTDASVLSVLLHA